MKLALYMAACVVLLSVAGCPQMGPVGTSDIVTATISASSTRGAPPLVVSFSGTSSTSRGGTLTGFAWDFAGLGTAGTADATFTFTTPGRYPVKLTVTDAAGNVGTQIVDIRVQGANPVAIIAADVEEGMRPLTVHFDGTASRATDDDILDYYWDFGDGQTSRFPSPTHVFTLDGQFTVNLRVITAGGAEGATTATITVSGGAASLQFDGTQLATLPVSPAQMLTEFTFEAWCQPDDRGGTLADIGGRSLLLELLPDSNVIRLQRGTEAFEITATNLAADWVHVALVYDASGATIIVNGTALDTAPFTGEVSISSIQIGSGFEGNIAEVRLWSIARTAGEINSQARVRLTGLETNLLAYWSIGEGAGEILRNAAPAGEDGYLGSTPSADTNDPAWSGDGPPV